jgi:hypothetical protein
MRRSSADQATRITTDNPIERLPMAENKIEGGFLLDLVLRASFRATGLEIGELLALPPPRPCASPRK